jgi:predicted metal-binding protein
MTKTKVPKPKPPTVETTNFSVIKKYGGAVGKQVTGFARIRTLNSKNNGITHDGLLVERQEYIYAEGYGMVKCIDYSSHFIFEDKSKKIGRWAFLCTCGSIAGIISYNEMKSLMTVRGTESGYVLACIAHTTSKQNVGIGKHADMVQE